MSKLCQKLKLSIEKLANPMGDEQIKFILEDGLNLTQVELCYPVNMTTHKSRLYHIKEALVIGLRQLVDKAVDQKMINLMSLEPHGESTTSKTSPERRSPTGVTTELDL